MLTNQLLALVKRAKLREKAKKPRKKKKRIKFHATHERLASCQKDEKACQVAYGCGCAPSSTMKKATSKMAIGK